jgi:hypothetical protein
MPEEQQERERIQYVRKKLLASIQVKSATTATLKLLQESIFEETDKQLGFNTLRRFFGLLPVGTPSFKTWSTFDQYLRSKRVLSSNDSEEFQELWAPTHWLNGLLARGTAEDLVEWLKAQHGLDIFPILMGTATNYGLATSNREMLTALYSEPALFKGRDSFGHYLAELVGNHLRTLPVEELGFWMPVLELPEFRENILYWFIDYEHLDGYYGQVLEALEPLHRGEALFQICLQRYNNYLRGEEFPAMERLTIAELQRYFPVLSGRYVGTLFLSGERPAAALWREYVRPLCAWQLPHLVCFELIPALILSRNYPTLRLLYDLHYEDLYDFDDWGSRQTTNIFLIAEAMLYLEEGNLRRAQIVWESIEIERTAVSYYHYTRLFYTSMVLRLLRAQGAAASEIERFERMKTASIEATGFVRFLEL